jgi:hypothetical protein
MTVLSTVRTQQQRAFAHENASPVPVQQSSTSVKSVSTPRTIEAWQRATPNPSIEGMPKRLRLLRTPHVKR